MDFLDGNLVLNEHPIEETQQVYYGISHDVIISSCLGHECTR